VVHGADTDGRLVAAACTIAIDDLPDGLIVADRFGRVLAVNRAAARLTGVKPESAVGRDMNEVFPFRDHDGRDWWKARDPEGGRRPGGGVRGTPLHLRGRRGVYGGAGRGRGRERGGDVDRGAIPLRDGGPRARLERSRADLVSTVAHELRSPLTSVKGF